RLPRRKAFCNPALDVLYDDDGVVDHYTDREDEPEERQVVHRESGRPHRGERADQRYRYRGERDDCGAPALEENEHDDYDQDDTTHEGLHHVAQALTDEDGRVAGDGVLHTRRKAISKLLHP